MMDKETKEALVSAAKAAENVSEVFNKLAGPLADEVGGYFADKVRDHRRNNWIAVVQQTR
jgi:hypothetical protein